MKLNCFKFRLDGSIIAIFLLNILCKPIYSQTRSESTTNPVAIKTASSTQLDSTKPVAIKMPSSTQLDTTKPVAIKTASSTQLDSTKPNMLNTDSLKIKLKESVNTAISVTKDAFRTTIDSSRVIIAPGFNSHLEAVDTLTQWMFQRKYRKPVFGFLSQTQFIELARSYDTLSPEVAMYGQYMQYKFKFEKELAWLRKYSRKNGININNADVDANKVILIRVNSVPPFKMARVEYVIQKKKEEYVVRFELIFMDEKWYYVNKCSIYRDK